MDATYVGNVPPAPPPGLATRSWRTRLTAALLVLLLVLVGLYFLESHWAETQLREAVAAADRLDPGWRWEELQARRLDYPPDQNGATQVLVARNLLPTTWPPAPPAPVGASAPTPETLDQFLAKVPAPCLLDPQFLAALREELDRVAPALEVARRLSGLPQGRYVLPLSPDFISTRMDGIQDARAIAILLRLDAARWAQEGSLDHALAACRGMVNVGRSMDGEPYVIALLVRCSCSGQALATLERTLAQGQAGADDLRAMQDLLTLEEQAMQPALLTALRGERAGSQLIVQCLQDGRLPLTGLTESHGDGWMNVLIRVHPGMLKRNQARCLSLSTELIELAKLPLTEQATAVGDWDSALKQQRAEQPYSVLLAGLLLNATPKTFTAVQRNQAKLRCAILALAVERYRLDHGRWPAALADLRPNYCPEVPLDPFTSQPLHLKQLEDGLLIYSTGADGIDNGGNLQPTDNPNAAGRDLGFRLWTVDQRRQQAR